MTNHREEHIKYRLSLFDKKPTLELLKEKVEYDKKKFPGLLERCELVLLSLADRSRNERNKSIYRELSDRVNYLIDNPIDKIKKIEINPDDLRNFMKEFYEITETITALYLEDLFPLVFDQREK